MSTYSARPSHGRDLNLALGCLVYDARILASALYVRRVRAGATAGSAAASELIVLKCRGLVDFLCRVTRDRRDIQISHFGVRPRVLPVGLTGLWKFASSRAAHLSWERAVDPLPLWPSLSGQTLDATGLSVLGATLAFIREQLESGRQLTTTRHRRHHRELEQLCGQLGIASPAPWGR